MTVEKIDFPPSDYTRITKTSQITNLDAELISIDLIVRKLSSLEFCVNTNDFPKIGTFQSWYSLFMFPVRKWAENVGNPVNLYVSNFKPKRNQRE